MSITPEFILHRQMNNWLSLFNLHLKQEEFDRLIHVFDGRMERHFIEYVKLKGNYLYNYNELYKVFPNLKVVYD